MEVKGTSGFLHLSLLIVCAGIYGAAERTLNETNCQRGNESLIATNVTCIYYNFHTMTCTWLFGIEHDNNSDVDTSCNYNISSDEYVQMLYTSYIPSSYSFANKKFDDESWRSCPNQGPMSCSWKYTSESEMLYVKVVIKNNKYNISTESSIEEINILSISKLPPAKDFTMTNRLENGCLSLVWNPPIPSMAYMCKVSSSSNCTRAKTLTILYNSGLHPSMICELYPFIFIKMSVKCKFIRRDTSGYWSDAVNVSKRIDPDVPYKSPNTTDGLYEASIKESNGFISIKVYFTPLNDCELHDNSTNVVYTISALEKTANTKHPNFGIEMDIPNNREINITIESRNSAGSSKKTSVVTVFPEMLVPSSSKLNIEYNNEEDCSVVKATITPTVNSTMFLHLFHTVVWCQGNLTSCKEPLKWVIIKTNETNLHRYSCNLYFRYGLITHGFNIKQGQVTSTRIHWIDNPILTQKSESDTGSASEIIVLICTTAAAVFICVTVFTIILFKRFRRKSRYLGVTVQDSRTTTPTSSVDSYINDQCETEELLTSRGRNACTDYSSTAPNWTKCINQKSVVSAGKLLRRNKLPTNEELQSISRTFGRKSDTLRDTCAKICETIEERIGSVTKVWPAYTVSSDKIVFVVESMLKLSKIRVKDYEIHSVNCHNTLEKEGENVMLKEKEILASYHKYDVEKFIQLKQSISKNAERLMDKHSNINVISPSVVKSVGYSTSGQHKLIETLCISIYVEKKVRSLIPIEEEPIPADIGGFPTDILEGKFSFFGKGPNDFHKTVKMGCGIHAGVKNEKGDTLGGTLGGFVQHRTHGLCCVTCAHLILSLAELQKAKTHGYLEYAENTGKRVYQPVSAKSEEFGRLVSVAFKEGLDGSPGVEVALIKVLYRHPTSGSFPQPNAGSDPKKAFEFYSGNVNDATLLRPMTEVYKFGMSTGPTVGRLGLSGAAVRGGSNHINDPNFGIRLYNQLEVYPEESSSFAAVGDSGALVLIGHTRPNTAAAIGIVEGGLPNGKVLVTPLFDALEKLKCPPSLKRFEDSSDSGVQVDMPPGAEAANDKEEMDCS